MRKKLIAKLGILGLAAIFLLSMASYSTDQQKDKGGKGKGGKSKTEWIEFWGDLVGGQPVDGCCPNAGPFPEYKMWLAPEVDGSEFGEWHDGQLFMNVLGGRRTDGQYIVQFGTGDCEVAIEIRGGVIDYDKKNKVLTVIFTDELCVDRCTNRIITKVTFTLVRRAY